MNGPVWDNKGLCHIGIRNFATSTMLYKQCVIRFMEENRNPSIKTKKIVVFFHILLKLAGRELVYIWTCFLGFAWRSILFVCFGLICSLNV